jgi:hypothetical protein
LDPNAYARGRSSFFAAHAWLSSDKLELRIARADGNPDDGIDWADLRTELIAK